MSTTREWHLENAPVMSTGMLIRRPVSEVFQALVDPDITTNFWFTKSTGRLTPGATVQWTWEMYDATGNFQVKEFEQDRLLVIEWGAVGASSTTFEARFTPRSGDTTFVDITETGYAGETGDEIVNQAIGSMGGFTQMLAALKAFLEHGIVLSVVADRFPDGKPG